MKFFKPLNPQQAASQLDQYFAGVQAKGTPKPLQIRVFSQKLGLDYAFPSDSTNQPFHLASIGKVFTAALVLMLADTGKLSLSDPICRYFSPAELDGLFVYQHTDYAQQVTVEHLLGHTSGIGDYFEGKTKRGASFTAGLLKNPHIHWTPQELIDFTRQHQTAVGVPGQVFNYSDTGYILLGQLIEKLTGQSFHENLQKAIFLPLDMLDSYLMFYSKPLNPAPKPLEKIWFNRVEISSFESLSCDWSGGGIVSTPDDLLKFNQALRTGRLVKPETLAKMDISRHKLRPGIHYGLGIIEIHFSEFFLLLRSLPKLKGAIGILATHLYYDPAHEAHIVMNFGDNSRMAASFQALIQIENTLKRIA
jgi:D-alanyl-D-alanine carboxypeptidase